MDESEKMILENMNKKIDKMNDNILYLCGRSANAGSRLKNIENIINNIDTRLNICENKVTTLRSWGIAVGTIIIIMIPIIAAMV